MVAVSHHGLSLIEVLCDTVRAASLEIKAQIVNKEMKQGVLKKKVFKDLAAKPLMRLLQAAGL